MLCLKCTSDGSEGTQVTFLSNPYTTPATYFSKFKRKKLMKSIPVAYLHSLSLLYLTKYSSPDLL